jgi:phosphoribosyl 1,2-cyclic phosphodiesterase
MPDIKIQNIASGSSGNCYRVFVGPYQLLIDPGITFKAISKAIKNEWDNITACLVSHEHGDHTNALRQVSRYLIPLIMTPGTKQVIQNQYKDIPKYLFSGVSVPDLTILTFPVIHDAQEPCGFLIRYKEESLLYITDTAYMEYYFTGLTHIMIECNYAKDHLMKNVLSGKVHYKLANRIINTHFEIENVARYLNNTDLSNVQEIRMIHMSKLNIEHDFAKYYLREAVSFLNIL